MSPGNDGERIVMAFELPPLPFPKNALEPYTSAKTLEFHHGKHHQTYVNTLNELIEGTPLERQSLEEIIKATYKDETKTKVFNNAAQVWNHNFFWNCLKPNAGGAPKGDIAQAIERDLGGFHKFEEDFKKAAVEQFGSGRSWLVADKGKLSIAHTLNGVDPRPAIMANPDDAKGCPAVPRHDRAASFLPVVEAKSVPAATRSVRFA